MSQQLACARGVRPLVMGDVRLWEFTFSLLRFGAPGDVEWVWKKAHKSLFLIFNNRVSHNPFLISACISYNSRSSGTDYGTPFTTPHGVSYPFSKLHSKMPKHLINRPLPALIPSHPMHVRPVTPAAWSRITRSFTLIVYLRLLPQCRELLSPRQPTHNICYMPNT